MNPWPLIGVALTLAAVLAGAAIFTMIGARNLSKRRRYAALNAEADHCASLAGARDQWNQATQRVHDGDTGHCPRCLIGRNDQYLPIVIPCPDHKPAGRHHYTAPVFDGEPAVAKPDHEPHDYVHWDHCDDCYATFERVSNGDHIDEWVAEWNRRYAR